ncbi:hypothetical protein [Pseudarthrobacter sp. B4EP4b]|uniref:hypothetical protein n=1 Tax=Pseudarthrobacter sp. B4EP4b TaxID=2590664 RepID=UPI0011504394|nr:hypothetical protein [Pseudarthrobacter sp. B4EP4b]
MGTAITTGGYATVGHEYILTEDDQPAADASLAEDIIELQLLTAGQVTGPVDVGHAQEHHNF